MTLEHRLIFIIGQPSAGKTTAAQTLNELFGWPIISAEAIGAQALERNPLLFQDDEFDTRSSRGMRTMSYLEPDESDESDHSEDDDDSKKKKPAEPTAEEPELYCATESHAIAPTQRPPEMSGYERRLRRIILANSPFPYSYAARVDHEHPGAFLSALLDICSHADQPVIIDGIRSRDVIAKIRRNKIACTVLSVHTPYAVREQRHDVHLKRNQNPYELVAQYAIEVHQPLIALDADIWIENVGDDVDMLATFSDAFAPDGTIALLPIIERCVLCEEQGTQTDNDQYPGVPLCPACVKRHAHTVPCGTCQQMRPIHDHDDAGRPRCKSCSDLKEVPRCVTCNTPLEPPLVRSPHGIGHICPACHETYKQTVATTEVCSFCHEPGRRIVSHKNGVLTCSRCYGRKRNGHPVTGTPDFFQHTRRPRRRGYTPQRQST